MLLIGARLDVPGPNSSQFLSPVATRWRRVKGPMSVVIATLLDAHVVPTAPDVSKQGGRIIREDLMELTVSSLALLQSGQPNGLHILLACLGKIIPRRNNPLLPGSGNLPMFLRPV